MDLPGDKHKSNPKNVTHEAFMKSLQSQRRVLGRVIKNEEQLKEIVDQLVAMGATLGEHGEIFDSHGIRLRKDGCKEDSYLMETVMYIFVNKYHLLKFANKLQKETG